MCGIIGIIGNGNIASEIRGGLIGLQHRGQDSCGIVTSDGKFHVKKGLGLVNSVIDAASLNELIGSMGIGHTRYVTAGSATIDDTHPFIIDHPLSIALAHNGNLVNFQELKSELSSNDINCDTKLILKVFADELDKNRGDDLGDSIFQAVEKVFAKAVGSYSVIAMIQGKGMVVWRDPNGVKPLVMGRRGSGDKVEYVFSSENSLFHFLEFDYIRDVEPGEVIFIDQDKEVHSKIIRQDKYRPCIFEYVYFARPDSTLDQVSVYRSRLRMGQNLAEKIKREKPDLKIDVVIPIPSTANTAALALAHELGVRYTEGLYKNHFIGRTFIMPNQARRINGVKLKLSPIDMEIRNKNVLLVDDSIVRGNTSKQIVNLVREHGAKNVYFASASPPLRFPCLYGIDMPSRRQFIAHELDIEGIKEAIGVDELIYQDLNDLIEAVTRRGDHNIKELCCACFDGKYPIGNINEEVLEKIETQRQADEKKVK